MISLLSSLAFADIAAMEPEGCSGLSVFASAPAFDMSGVPLDANLTIQIEASCAQEAFNTNLFYDDGTGERLEEASQEGSWTVLAGDGSTVILSWDRDVPLRPDTSYRLEILPVGWGEVTSLPFSTGAGSVRETSGLPEMTLRNATAWEGEEGAEVDVSVSPAPDPDALSWLAIRYGDGLFFLTPAVAFEENVWIPIQAGGDVCLQASQFDGLGREIRSEESCVTPRVNPRDEGNDVISGPSCDNAGGRWAGLGLLGALWIRRRAARIR